MKLKVCILVLLTSLLSFSYTLLAFSISNENLAVYVLEDKTNTWTIDSILSPNIDNKFIFSPNYLSQFGFQTNPFWIKVMYNSAIESEMILTTGSVSSYDIQLYQVKNGKSITSYVSGRKYASENVSRQLRLHSFDLKFTKGENTFYIRAISQGYLSIPIIIRDKETFKSDEYLEELAYGMFFGVMLAMIVYNLVLFFSLGDRTYIYYVTSMVFGFLVTLVISGHSYYFLWANSPNLDGHIYMAFGGLAMMASSRFTANFLHLHHRNKLLDNLLWFISLMGFLMAILSLFYTDVQIRYYGQFLTLVAVPSYLIIGVWSYRKGYKPALYFVIAWSAYVAGLVISTLKGLGLVPYHIVLSYSSEIGFTLETMLLSLALADRINLMKKEIANKEVEKLELKAGIIEEQKVVLEKTVEERTVELKASNNAKDKLFAIVSHDLRGAITSFKGIGEIIDFYLDKKEHKKVKEITKNIDKNANQLNNLLDNVLHWSVMQMNETTLKKEPINLKLLSEEMIHLYFQSAKSKGIALHAKVKKDAIVVADVNAMNVIFRNFISNAIKFTNEGGNIWVNAIINDNEVLLSFKDDGVGMEKSKADSLFKSDYNSSEIGTKGEQGIGLGLKLCLHFIEKHDARIEVNSELGKGTEFLIRFPIKSNPDHPFFTTPKNSVSLDSAN